MKTMKSLGLFALVVAASLALTFASPPTVAYADPPAPGITSANPPPDPAPGSTVDVTIEDAPGYDEWGIVSPAHYQSYQEWVTSGYWHQTWVNSGYWQRHWVNSGYWHQTWVNSGYWDRTWVNSGYWGQQWVSSGYWGQRWVESGYWYQVRYWQPRTCSYWDDYEGYWVYYDCGYWFTDWEWADTSHYESYWVDTSHYESYWVDTSHYQSYWVDTSHYENDYWVDTSHWFNDYWVDTSHYENDYWVNTSHYETRQQWVPDQYGVIYHGPVIHQESAVVPPAPTPLQNFFYGLANLGNFFAGQARSMAYNFADWWGATETKLNSSDPAQQLDALWSIFLEVTLVVTTVVPGVGVIRAGRFARLAAADAAGVTSKELVELTAKKHAERGVEYLLNSGKLSDAEIAAYRANPTRGSRFLGKAVHELTAEELEPKGFTYFRKGIDFVDNTTGTQVELTTVKGYEAHFAKYGRLPEYAEYELP